MIKAFISHSSKQKDTYAFPIVEDVGRDQCFIDAYDFEPAFKTLEEIIDKIGKSSIFVFLASKESLKSSWCDTEVKKAKREYEQGNITLFLVYIVDPNISYQDLPDWISKDECFNLKYFRSPKLIARDINQKIRFLQWKNNPKLEIDYNIFVGRNKEIGEFQDKKSLKPLAKALIVSGRPGSGREHFARRCMQECKMPRYALPELLYLERDNSLEDIISQLNAITFLLSDECLKDVLSSDEDTKLNFTIEQLNEICAYGYVIINDSRSIVRDGGRLSEWFTKLLNHPDLPAELKTYIASSRKLRANEEINNSNLIYIDFNELTDKDRRIILTRYIDEYGAIPLTPEEVKYFSDRLLHSPFQLKKIARIIAERGVQEAKRCLGAEEEIGRGIISQLINEFADNNDAIQFLLLMAKLESVSYDDIKGIYLDEYYRIENIIPQLLDCALISEFGPSNYYLKIDTAVGDYLQRSKLSIDKKLRYNLENYLANIAKESPVSITEDLTTYMLTLREAYKDGRVSVEQLFLPSIALKTIISLYQEDKQDSYLRVEVLCTELLNKGHIINLNLSFREDVTYWLCLALAHLGKAEEFFKYVLIFRGDRANFLKGFWYRLQHNFNSAKSFYQKILDSPYSTSKKRTQTEMVIVLTQLKDYENAFKLAQELYEQDKDNPYYISVLFTTSIRSKKDVNSDKLQAELIDRMRKVMIKDQEQYIEAMQLYQMVKNLNISRAQKFDKISNLREEFQGKMVPYLNDAINFSIDYLR